MATGTRQFAVFTYADGGNKWTNDSISVDSSSRTGDVIKFIAKTYVGFSRHCLLLQFTSVVSICAPNMQLLKNATYVAVQNMHDANVLTATIRARCEQQQQQQARRRCSSLAIKTRK